MPAIVGSILVLCVAAVAEPETRVPMTLVKGVPLIEVRLNGKLVTTSDDLARLKLGYIGLQGESGFHEYRNFRIKDLSK